MARTCTIPNCEMTTTGWCPKCDGPERFHPPSPPFVTGPGCICPPTSEQTCMNPFCPRRGGIPSVT